MQLQEYINTYDPTLQFNVLRNSYKQIEYALNLNIDNTDHLGDVDSIIVSGMGGSAISADLIKNYLGEELKKPFLVNRSYLLPAFADERTLLIISSYSGNTEETLSVLKEGIKRNCKIVCITTGGEAKEIGEERGLYCVPLMDGMQPRYSLGQSFFVLLRLLESLKLIPPQENIIRQIAELWRQKGEELTLEANQAFKYAESLVGYIPLIYSAADYTDAAGYRLKCQFNENSKLHAFHNIIPELNHNEIIGWESFNQKDFRIKVISLIDKSYPEQIKKRFQITSELITAKETEIINLQSDQDSFKIRLFDLIYLSDWITYYLSVLRGFDPVEIDYINILKNRLK
jgi:glucose/mannose-6-phosphate isomerase